MSILAGIFSRIPSHPIPDRTCTSIRKSISRDPNDQVTVHRGKQVFFAKVDIDAYRVPGFQVSNGGSISMLAGEPLLMLGDSGFSRTREDDLARLHDTWDREDSSLLQCAQGFFCAAHFHRDRLELTLVADKLGLRPFFYWEGKEYVVFSTALRVLETLADVPKSMDVRGITELTSLGFTLSNRTPYSGISRLDAAEIVKFSSTRSSHSRYWRWDQIPLSSLPEPQQVKDSYECFDFAVACRLRKDRSTVSTLSGGLDSRCVTALLKKHNATVCTFNFADPGTQDRVLGADFARAIGTIHQELDLTPDQRDPLGIWTTLKADWETTQKRIDVPAERPNLLWTGGGGSVGLGHVYVTNEIVQALRAGKRGEAADIYIRQQKKAVLLRLIKSEVKACFSDILRAGIEEALAGIRCEDPARDFHLFLMLYEQRSLFPDYFENIDIYKLEPQLPFLDGKFMESIVASPVDLCLRHRFYGQLLKFFPPEVTAVPWQAYPTHEPCPLPIPSGLAYQWQGSNQTSSADRRKQKLMSHAREMMKSRIFPHPIFRHWYLRLASQIYGMGLRDYGYVIEGAYRYYTHWLTSEGKYELPVGAIKSGGQRGTSKAWPERPE